jgi:hypothetical protein
MMRLMKHNAMHINIVGINLYDDMHFVFVYI